MANQVFDEFDIDNSGQLEKGEFRSYAKKIITDFNELAYTYKWDQKPNPFPEPTEEEYA
jgi:Ca2+-binding EF-hand superfamily protein